MGRRKQGRPHHPPRRAPVSPTAPARHWRWLGVLALTLSPLYLVMLVRLAGNPIRTVTWAYAAFLMGTLFELTRLATSVKDAAWLAAWALAVSLFNFFPYKRETAYSLQRHLDNWPIVFVVVLLVGMVSLHAKRLTARMGEGNALLYSIAFFYWMLERHARDSGPLVLVVVAAMPLAYAAIHALTGLPLSRGVRLALSLWCAVVMGALGVRYAMAVIGLGSVEARLAAADLEGGVLIFAEFLLLGAAGPAIAQNLTMVLGYLPGKGRFFNRQYFEEVRKLSSAHVERFSSDQVPRGEAAVATVLVGVLLAFNWSLRLVSGSFVAWFLVAAVPWVMAGWAWWTAVRSRATAEAAPGESRALP